MKKFVSKLSIAVTALSLVMVSCSKEEAKKENTGGTTITVEEKNRAFVMDVTGTWCPPCGSYGIPGFNKAVELAGDRMLPLAAHSSDPLSHSATNTLAALNRFKSTSVPRIAVGNGLRFPAGVYSDVTATANAIVASVDTFNSKPVIVGATLSNYKIDATGGMQSVDVTTKFFQNTDGEYYLSVYFMEDGVVSDQKLATGGSNPTQEHNHTFRASASGDAWGSVLASGSISSGASQTKSFSFMYSPMWKTDKMSAYAVIWKKVNASDWVYVNGNMIHFK